jgi:SpoVK/Ycf46/Vps4 family AAA+-type ATPase
VKIVAYEDLEKIAARNVTEAITLDKQGSRGMAIAKYQRAVEVLLKLCELYPGTPQNRVYAEKVQLYNGRIGDLQHGNDPSPLSQGRLTNQAPERAPIVEKPDVKWDDIANLSDAKRAIEESIIYPSRRPDLFPLGWPRGILFYGPPGCGKTLLAAAMATEIDATFYCIDSPSIVSKWLGESEKNVAKLFQETRDATREGKTVIMFIDEVDSIMGIRSHEVGGEVRARNQFLKEMDGISDKKKQSPVYVIGATNKPWDLDEAFIRRFQKRVYVPPPDVKARLEMFRIYSRNIKVAENIDFAELAGLTEGCTGSDIRDIFQAVQTKVVREFFENREDVDPTAKPREILMSDFLEVVATHGRTVSEQGLTKFRDWTQNYLAG